jgi:phage shock protein A
MALINRLSRLFAADLHAVLDRIEEPDVLLKHAMREMEEELAHGEHQQRQLESECATLDERYRDMQELIAKIGEQLDVCFANGNDELARKVLKRRLETERLLQHVAARRAALDKALATHGAALQTHREQLDVMRQKAELVAVAPTGGDPVDHPEFAVGDDEVEVAFLRERQQRRPS